MNEPLIFLTDPDEARRDGLVRIIRAAEPVAIEAFSNIHQLRRAIRERRPDLLIGPWTVSGETLLAVRSLLRARDPGLMPPKLIILTDYITPARIALTRSAGDAELIPCDPIDPRALLNRVILTLHGADWLGASLPSAAPESEFSRALQNLPALRKRLAA